MTGAIIKITDMGTIVVEVGKSIYTFPLHKLIHIRDWYYDMEQQR